MDQSRLRAAAEGVDREDRRRQLRPRPQPRARRRRRPPAATPVRVAVLYGGRRPSTRCRSPRRAAVRAAWPPRATRCRRSRSSATARGRTTARPLSLRPGGGLLGADVVFPVLHGPFGEDGTVQGLLELLDVPYVGAGVLASSLCMDKVVFKELMAAAGVPQVPTSPCARRAGAADPVRCAQLAALGMPVFVKPARLGSSVGIAKVSGRAELDGRARDAFAHDSAGDRRGVLRRARGRVLGDRALRPGGLGARARSSSRRPTGTTTRPSTPTGGMELRHAAAAAGRGRRGGPPPGPRGVPARRLRRSRAGRLLRRGRPRAGQRAQHDARASPPRASSRSCGRPPASRSRSSATGCSASRSSASSASAPATLLVPATAAACGDAANSDARRSRPRRPPGGSA